MQYQVQYQNVKIKTQKNGQLERIVRFFI